MRTLQMGVFAIAAMVSFAQSPPADDLTSAYHALAQKDYDKASELFRRGLAKQPQNAAAHKDLAYTLLKMGENAEARDQFAEAMRLNTADETAALEYAFLCNDTKMPIEARRTFDRLRKRSSAATRTTAEQAFQNIDKPLAAGIARWQQALARSANPLDISLYSAHLELAQLAEQRDELPLAAEQYEICRRMKPNNPGLLLDLARVWQQLNRVDEARAALVAASRAKESRTAELALAQFGTRYPYPYEFQKALELDPKNLNLSRELAFLYLAMNEKAEATQQFERVLQLDPHDSLAISQLAALRGIRHSASVKAQQPPPAQPATANAKSMGQKSLALGYTTDAIKYLKQAHQQDPSDAQVMLQLGWAYNMAKDDGSALQWFDLASRSDDEQIAAEASKAKHNLEGGGQPLMTVWALPMYSSRWKDAFTYGQVKRVIPLPWLKANKAVSFYLSTRFMGDAKSGLPSPNGIAPQYLSESSFIFGAGIASHTWHHLTAWAEAGEAVQYLPSRTDVGLAIPDYRGGVNFAKGYGNLLGTKTTGLFYETTADAVYVNRYEKDWLFYSQHRAGRTFRFLGGSYAQALFNVNFTHDTKNQYWANTAELGPGVRVHLPWMPPSVYFEGDFLRGVYTNNEANPRRPNYDDVRLSLWYALSK